MRLLWKERLSKWVPVGICLAMLWGKTGYADPDNFYELGATLGRPAPANFVLGYWGGPALFRLSGMFWNTNTSYGIQTDYGWAFDRKGPFKQYVCLTGMREKNLTKKNKLDAIVIGAQYGLNWHGFSAQVGWGLSFNQLPTRVGTPLFQLGYTYLFDAL